MLLESQRERASVPCLEAGVKWPWSKPEKPQTVVELDLGPNDMLVMTSEQTLSEEVCRRLQNHMEVAMDRPGRTAIVLGEGLSLQVVRRP